MKALIIALAFTLTGCSSLPLPIKAKVCYNARDGQVCVESDGDSLTLLGNLNGFAK